MGFSAKQMRALQRSVPSDKVRVRRLNGRELPYIEGWQAIAEANRIFGFAGWDRETLEARCIVGRDVRGTFHAIYAAKVRVTVRAEISTVVREGSGTGEARSTSPGEAHEIALKAAETDATKRALATFGKPFGLALYLTARSTDQRAPEGRQSRVASAGANGVAQRPRGSGQPEARGPTEAHSASPSKATCSDGSSAGSGKPHDIDNHNGVPSGSAAITNGSQDGSAASEESHSKTGPSVVPSTVEQSAPEFNTQAFRQEGITPAGRPQAETSAANNGSIEGTKATANTHGLGPSSEVGSSSTPSPQASIVQAPSPIPARVDKSVLPFGAPRRERDKHHLQFVARQPCLICSRIPSDAHHLRFAQTRAMGRKVGDQFTVPLCRMHHRQVHESSNEADWWSDLEIDALGIASGLWEESRAKRAALVRSLPGSIDPLRG